MFVANNINVHPSLTCLLLSFPLSVNFLRWLISATLLCSIFILALNVKMYTMENLKLQNPRRYHVNITSPKGRNSYKGNFYMNSTNVSSTTYILHIYTRLLTLTRLTVLLWEVVGGVILYSCQVTFINTYGTAISSFKL